MRFTLETKRRLNIVLAILSTSVFSLAACAQSQLDEANPCGPLSENHYGPFDYRTATNNQKALVENAHFRQKTYTALQGITGSAGGDINYTLRAFPNHYRALDAMRRLAEKERQDQPSGAMYTIECYYERAIRFRSDDLIVRMLYADFLIRRTRPENARAQLDFVASQAGENPQTHFNVGLLFTDLKIWDRALEQAHTAISLGYMRPDLKDRLQAVGRWVEPPPNVPHHSTPAASAP